MAEYTQQDYLEDLLSYADLRVEFGPDDEPLDVGEVGQQLAEVFLQPFDRLVEDGNRSIGEQPVLQIHVGVEILRRYLESQAIDTADADSAYLQRAYQELLLNLGTSFDELRMTRGGGDDEDIEETRLSLADRLGIEVEQLDALFIEPDDLTEARLEQAFGLPATAEDPFDRDQTDSTLLRWRADHLRRWWQAQPASEEPDASPTPPLIDPDLITAEMIIDQDQDDSPAAPDSEIIDPDLREAPLELWDSRRQEIDEIDTNVQATIDDATEAESTVLAAYDAVLESFFGAIDLETELTSRTEGAAADRPDEAGQLALLDLSALRRLVRLRKLAESGTLTDLEWEDARAIVVQFSKQQRFASWHDEERELGLFLSPDFFALPETRSRQPLPPWRATRQARLNWEDSLRARTEQIQTTKQALQTAIDSTASTALIELREGLIRTLADEVDRPDHALLADTLTNRLLFDFKTSDDRKTTRMEQAIETVQGLFFALRMGRIDEESDGLPDNNPAADWDLDLITESDFEEFIFTEADFDEDWHWMGTYAARRAAEFVKDHPENYLRPSLRDVGEPGQPPTEAFWELIDDLRARSRLTPGQARTLAQRYFETVEDSSGGDFRTVIDNTLTEIGNETEGNEGAAAESFELAEQLSESDLILRRRLVAALFEDIEGSIEDDYMTDTGETIQILNPHLAPQWLQEVFYFVPMAIAIALQRSGEYLAALDWYQTVYAYQFADNADTDNDERKIYHGLNLEGEFSDRPRVTPDNWLRDELHPHQFARQRKFTYTRFTVISIVQCLLDYADAEFTSELPESLLRARALYLTARNLLEESEIPAGNPRVTSLRRHAEVNLEKLRSGRNIAGMEMPSVSHTEPESDEADLPAVGRDGRPVARRSAPFQPTPYRYSALIDRAKHLVNIAQQMEGAYLSALEKRDGEAYSVLQANQDLQLAEETVQLQHLRVDEAEGGVELAKLQQERAQIQHETYQEWIAAGLNQWELATIENYWKAAEAQIAVAELQNTASMLSAWSSITGPADIVSWGVSSVMGSIELQHTKEAISAQTRGQTAAMRANFERRKDEWELQANLAEQDVEIGAQQIELAQDHLQVVAQERNIADLQADHAKSEVDFLANKFTNVELYEWMSGVLGRVYSYFLQQATATARLAQNQLAFQRQDPSLSYIQADYWEPPSESNTPLSVDGEDSDRRGLTGSARLLQDIYRLDQYAFETDERKLQLTQTVSLARLAPFEFEQFRETGVLPFATPMELFDQSFPGHYLRQIKRVRTSVVALIPPSQGIRATLAASGISKVVTGGSGDPFRTEVVRRQPEQVALTSPTNATGLFELTPAGDEDMLLPFENMGVDTSWELRMPKASNPFDYATIADVLLTIEYTALDSPDYRHQVIQNLDNSVSADRSFSFREQFADQWYDLHNPDRTETPMTVQFRTRREDFPTNVDDLELQQVLLYVSRTERAPSSDEVIEVGGLHFTSQEDGITVGGEATSMTDGAISTRRSNGTAWTGMIGKSPVGEWELQLPDTDTVKNWFEEEQIEDILLVLTFEGQTPAWPN